MSLWKHCRRQESPGEAEPGGLQRIAGRPGLRDFEEGKGGGGGGRQGQFHCMELQLVFSPALRLDFLSTVICLGVIPGSIIETGSEIRRGQQDKAECVNE